MGLPHAQQVFVKGAKKCCATFADCFDFVIVQPIQEKLMEWKKKYPRAIFVLAS